MTSSDYTRERMQNWLSACMPDLGAELTGALNIKNVHEREVWDCSFNINQTVSQAILTIFKPGSQESVNTNLPPHQAAQKCFLAMTELPGLGIPTPVVLGQATDSSAAAVLCERIEQTEWHSEVRIEAARILGRIHNLGESSLSQPLQELARISNPREHRITGGKAPQSKLKRFVHGDYFSANILPVAGGLRIIDWETFGWGDPMWDLSFLIGADHGLPVDEVEAVIAAYESVAEIDQQQLMWHRQRWIEFWKERGS